LSLKNSGILITPSNNSDYLCLYNIKKGVFNMLKPFPAIIACFLVISAFPQTRQDPPADQHYDFSFITKEGREGVGATYMTNGPAGEADDCDLSKGLTVDMQGNAYYTNTPYSVVRRYSKSQNRVTTFAGSAKGYLDGPIGRARFGGWGYNNTNIACVSDDGKHLFVRDGVLGLWRYIDVDSGMVSTVGPSRGSAGAYIIIAKDCMSGDIYAFMANGGEPPNCKGYNILTTVNITASIAGASFDGIALDVSKMMFYCHYRGPSISVNLSTGDSTTLTGALWCPTGMSISQSGRYLYIGGGDDMFCWRKDISTGDLYALGRSAAAKTANGIDIWFKPKDTDFSSPISTSTAWPGTVVFPGDGAYGLWATRHGLFIMNPRN
jgi:hypothetical protein